MRKHLESDDPGHDEEKRHDHVKKSGSNHSDARVPLVLGAEDALDNMLARAAIPNSHRKKSGEDAGHRKWMVSWRLEHLEMLGVRLNESSDVAHATKRQDRDQKPRKEQNYNLEK